MELTFREFSAANRTRCEAPDGFNHALGSWSTSDWFVAVVGELGEAANIVKKLNRYRDGVRGNKVSEPELRAHLRQEIADAFIYLDLIAQACGFDLGTAVIETFNAKSKEIGYAPDAALLVLGDARVEQVIERIARQAHDGQTEESTGDDYIHHVERVVGMVDGDAKIVAWLHDVVEDSDVSFGELSRAGIPSHIVDAVRLLTHGGEQETRTYAEYIEDIRRVNDPLALAVKIADLHDHLRPNCPERLRPRYEKALIILGDVRDPRPSEP